MQEKNETLFCIVHDEAHFASLKNSLLDSFINDPEIAGAANVILLQVSATPYCLVTQNTRIPSSNVINWFKKNETGAYYGIKVLYNCKPVT